MTKAQAQQTEEWNEDEAMAALEASLDGEIVAVEEEASEEDFEAVLTQVEAEEAREASYAEQDSGADPEIAAADPATEKAAKRTRTNTKGLTPSQIIRSKVPNFAEVLIVTNEIATRSEADREKAVEELIAKFDEQPKKVGEKLVNVACNIANGVGLSVYTKIAVDLLAAKEIVTLADIRNNYLSGGKRPYSLGTANAQASQMMKVLPMLGIAERDGKELRWVSDSPLGAILLNAQEEEEEAA